jgi:hypothetical protein
MKDGGPAFPMIEQGMSLRDYFAAAALQGFIADGVVTTDGNTPEEGAQRLALCAYMVADEMLERRK